MGGALDGTVGVISERQSEPRCVDCGYLAEVSLSDGLLQTLKESQRIRYAKAEPWTCQRLRCFREFDGFVWKRVRETIDCPVFVRRIPDQSPKEHFEMERVLEARREAQEASVRLRRQGWITMAVTVVAILLGSVVAALIGRGIILG